MHFLRSYDCYFTKFRTGRKLPPQTANSPIPHPKVQCWIGLWQGGALTWRLIVSRCRVLSNRMKPSTHFAALVCSAFVILLCLVGSYRPSTHHFFWLLDNFILSITYPTTDTWLPLSFQIAVKHIRHPFTTDSLGNWRPASLRQEFWLRPGYRLRLRLEIKLSICFGIGLGVLPQPTSLKPPRLHRFLSPTHLGPTNPIYLLILTAAK